MLENIDSARFWRRRMCLSPAECFGISDALHLPRIFEVEWRGLSYLNQLLFR